MSLLEIWSDTLVGAAASAAAIGFFALLKLGSDYDMENNRRKLNDRDEASIKKQIQEKYSLLVPKDLTNEQLLTLIKQLDARISAVNKKTLRARL